MNPEVEEPRAGPSRIRERSRRFAPLVLVAFMGLGVWLFASRMPKDVSLRFVVPPTLYAANGTFVRGLTASLSGTLADDDGARVGTFDVAIDRVLEGPLAPPVAMQLRPGRYRVVVEVRALNGLSAPLRAELEVEGEGEIRVELER